MIESIENLNINTLGFPDKGQRLTENLTALGSDVKPKL